MFGQLKRITKEWLDNYGSETRTYLPNFIVSLDDGHGAADPLHLVVEIKGYRREDAKEKKSTMDTYWVPVVNHLGTHGRWAFGEFTDMYMIEADSGARIEARFDAMIERSVEAHGELATLALA